MECEIKMDQPIKMMLFGLDGASPELIEMFVKKGELPHIAKLIKNGVFAENALSFYPTITPPNWTSITTGACIGTHGVIGFYNRHPGDPPEKFHSGFDTRECKAEYLWNAAERDGKKSIILKFPGSWPPTIKEGIVIDGCGPGAVLAHCTHQISGPHLYSTEEYPRSTKIKLTPASDWSNIPPSASPPLEGTILISERGGVYPPHLLPKHRASFNILVLDSVGKGYDKVIISSTKDGSKPLATLSVGKWSDWLTTTFETENGQLEGTLRFKLMELSNDAKKIKLYVTQVMSLEGWSYPEKIARELVHNCGPFLQHPGYFGAAFHWTDDETFVEEVEYQNSWFANASIYLLKKYKWDLYFMQTHCIDYLAHLGFIKKCDPLTAKDVEQAEYYTSLTARVLRSIDSMIGKIINEVANENTLIIVVSDHGEITSLRDASVKKILEDAGMISYKKDSKTGARIIDPSKSKAFVHECYIYINLKGREPCGIVDPGLEYEKVRDQIIEILLSYKDPETGTCPFSMVLRKEDARVLGLYGERVGDIIFAHKPGFGHEHGTQLSTTKLGMSSLRSLFIMTGPGVRKNYRLQRNVWLTDIVPTICYLMNLPIPENAEGAILYEALVDKNAKKEEIEFLKKEVEKWKDAYRSIEHLSHTY